MSPKRRRRIWGEGLATYVSGRMNPGADELALLLTDKNLSAARERLGFLASLALEHLDDTSSVYAKPWLQGGTSDKEVPARAGYLVGLHVAERIGRERSLTELARMSPTEVRVQMEATLREIIASERYKAP